MMCNHAHETLHEPLDSSKRSYSLRFERQITADCSSQRPRSTGHAAAFSEGIDTQNNIGEVDDQLPPWEKVLWKRQPYPDNYTDDSFLQQLVRLPWSRCSCGVRHTTIDRHIDRCTGSMMHRTAL